MLAAPHGISGNYHQETFKIIRFDNDFPRVTIMPSFDNPSSFDNIGLMAFGTVEHSS
jgi:hypothetical protein